MADLHVTITAAQVSAQPSPTPNLATNATTPNTNWNTFSATPAIPTVPSSTLDNPGVVHSPPTSSPNVAPHTNDPAFIISTADARATYQWPDGSWRAYPVNLTAENLAYGTGPLYANAGGFGGPFNNPGTNPVSPFNPAVAQK
jgi:hypothetical protein